MTQGDPLSPTIFNMVVDVVVRQCVTVMVEGAEERGKHEQEGRHKNSLFYADDDMVASSDPRWLHGKFSTLVGLFNRVGLQDNVSKTVGMVCRPFQAAGTQSEAAYGGRMTGEGPSYRERQKGRVQRKACGKEMAAGSMAGHMTTQRGQAAEELWSWTTSAKGEELRKYCMAFLAKGGPRSFPVEGCPGRATPRTAMRVHFLH